MFCFHSISMLDCNVEWKKKKKNKKTNIGYLCSHFWYGWYSEPYSTDQFEVCVHLVWTNLFFHSAFSKSVVVVEVLQLLPEECEPPCWILFMVATVSQILAVYYFVCCLFVCYVLWPVKSMEQRKQINKHTPSPPPPQKSNALKYASSITIHVHRRRPSPVRPARHLQAVVPPAEKWFLT